MSKIAVVLIRGLVGIRFDMRDTLKALNLNKKHTSAVVEDTPTVRGRLNKVKDFTTFGIINEETLKELQEKRGQKDSEGNLKKAFFLAPPKGGFERKGIKKAFTIGGALGERGDAINELIKKMM